MSTPHDRTFRVLLIDDDEEFGKLTARRLARVGIDVDFHKGAFGATTAVLRGDYVVVLLDVNMPALSGPSLLEVLRRQGMLRGLRVVFFSSADSLAELARVHGADGHLSKGASQNELIAVLSAALSAPPKTE